MKKYISLLVIALFILVGKINAYMEYDVGDQVTYNGVDYYVIKDSSFNDENVTMLKAEPLTVDEVNSYGVGHINMYATADTSSDYYQKAFNQNGYGGMQYYSSPICTYYRDRSGCKTNYMTSEVKYVVDAWAKSNIKDGLVEARLIKLDELFDNLGYERSDSGTIVSSSNGNTPAWVYSNKYTYYTMDKYGDSDIKIRAVHDNGNILNVATVILYYNVVRPVITIKKEVLEKPEKMVEYNNNNYYIIKEDSDTVTLLKTAPITSSEIKDYLSSTEVKDNVDITGKYALMPYYTKDNCVSSGDMSGCSTDYKVSDIKQVVDVWAKKNLKINDLVKDSTGYEVRLLTVDELEKNLGYEYVIDETLIFYKKTDITPDWTYKKPYDYWTMSQFQDSENRVYVVGDKIVYDDIILKTVAGYTSHSIRPVITLKRSAIYGEDNSKDSINEKMNDEKVIVTDTYQKKSLIIILIGFIMLLVGIITYYSVTKVLKERK